MKKFTFTLSAILILVTLSSHDMFLKLKSYYVSADSNIDIHLYNGTFDKSENVITRDRMTDVSMIYPDGTRDRLTNDSWTDQGNITVLSTQTKDPGSYVVGVSTLPKMIELSSEDFNNYLAHDGVMDVLNERKKSGEDQKNAREKYSKHVKAIFQAGASSSGHYKKKLGYPIEFIPVQNPYDLKVNGDLQVQLLSKGQPVSNQLVYASYAGFHGHSDTGGHVEAIKTRTNNKGVATITLSKAGHWYVRAIHMVKSNEEGVDYESNWATLTFEIKE
ncbi:MAG: DUF4198 domain-containing protein [Cyclobacteriaceae bacterium]|nr:DUF4198 domain-containing protein [Cyclobacteriaceae bacterium]